jgi:hypothetical protein
MIRVLYRLRFRREDLDELRQAWREVVAAHTAAGHACLESMFLMEADGSEDPRPRALAISRWKSLADWQTQRRDDVDADAYARFRRLCEVEDKQVFDELELLRVADTLDPLELLSQRFDLTEDEADRLFELVLWVEQEIATEIHGYPRDNLIPPPLSERLEDASFVDRLQLAAADQDPDLVHRLASRKS